MKRNDFVGRGFTLIELLVVIAVIAVLAAILFPVFAQAREKARQTACLSHVKQIAMATGTYVQDYDETFPLSAYIARDPGGAACVVGVDRAIWPYTRSAELWHCPTNPKATDINQGTLAMARLPTCSLPTAAPNANYVSYQGNQSIITEGKPNPLFLLLTGGTYDGRPAVRLAELEYPAETSVFYDGVLTAPGGACGFAESLVDARHHRVLNATWADGHVKVVKAALTGQTCYSWDGKTTPHALVADSGPYQGQSTLTGLPYKKTDGSWGLR